MMGSVPETVVALAISWKTDCLRRCLVQDEVSMLRLTDGGFCYEAFGRASTHGMILWLFCCKYLHLLEMKLEMGL